MDLPFRWNLAHRDQLGALVQGEPAESYRQFLVDLLPCCSRVLAFSGGGYLVFVGRSPESIFDHLSGLLFDTSWAERLALMHFSMRHGDAARLAQENPGGIQAMRDQLRHLGLHPEGIATAGHPVAFIDLVFSGSTFGSLTSFLYTWSREIGFDWRAVRRRIRLIGITERTKTSPKTWRWQQHAAWLDLLDHGAVKNVSIPYRLWNYLGNTQQKVTLSYTPGRWGDPAASRPSYSEDQLRALRLAYTLFELGRLKAWRKRFAARLAREKAMEEAWCRAMVRELRS